MDPEFLPCSYIDGAILVCCASNRTNHFAGSTFGGPTADKCLPNGLCQNVAIAPPSETIVRYWRNGCTTTPVDPEHCLDVCIQPDEVVRTICLFDSLTERPILLCSFVDSVQIGGGFAIMTPCDGNSNSTMWCCGNDTTCCGTSAEVSLAATLGVALPSSTSASTALPTSDGSSTSPSATLAPVGSPSPTGSVSRQSMLNAGALAGIVISTIITVVAVLVLFLLWRRWNKRKASLDEAASGAAAGSTLDASADRRTWPSHQSNVTPGDGPISPTPKRAPHTHPQQSEGDGNRQWRKMVQITWCARWRRKDLGV